MLEESSRAALIWSCYCHLQCLRDARALRGEGVYTSLLEDAKSNGATNHPYFTELVENRAEVIGVIDKMLEFVEKPHATFTTKVRCSLLAGVFHCMASVRDAQETRGEAVVDNLLAEGVGISHPFVEALRNHQLEAAQLVDAMLDLIEKGV